MKRSLPLGLVVFLCVLALSSTGTTPVSHAAASNVFTFAVGGDHSSLTTGSEGFNSLSRLATAAPAFYLGIGDLSYTNTTTGDIWCGQFKSKFNNIEIVAGNHDTGEENGTAATRSYEKFVNGCPYTLSPPLNSATCGPVASFCYGREYYFDYPSTNPLARFVVISPRIFNVTGLCLSKCNSSFGSPCTDLYGCWPYTANDLHYNWVSNAIDTARASGVKWVIVSMHKDCISAGVQNCSIGADLFKLMVSKKVDLILEGHDHSYQRSKQLALTSTCTSVPIANSFPQYDPNCVVNDGSSGFYTPGAGTVVVIQGTFGAGLNVVNDTSANGGASAAEAPYFATLMGSNTPGNGHGFLVYTVSPDRIDVKTSFSGSFSDSFSIGQAFTLSSNPSFLGMQAGASGTSTITLTSQGGFAGTVNLNIAQTGCLGCVSGLSSISPSSVGLTAGGTAPAILQIVGSGPGNATITVTGTSGGISSSTTVAVSVQDFSLSASKTSLTINFGSTGSFTINLASLNHFAGTVTLSATSTPPGLATSLNSASVTLASGGTGFAVLSVTGSNPGNYTVMVTGTSGPTSHLVTITVQVLGDFTVNPNKTTLTLSGGSADSSIIITVGSSNGFYGTINLSTSIFPSGLSGPTATFGLTSLKLPANGSNGTTLTVNAGMVEGVYSINVTGTSGNLSHSTIITVTVTKANPTISTSLSASTVTVGGSVQDSSLLTSATTNAGGTVTYSVFRGTACSGTAVFVQIVPVANGVAPSSRMVQFNITGAFQWQANYSGDASNVASSSPCGNEPLAVNKTNPGIVTSLSATTITVESSAFDTSTLTGSFQAGGTVTYSWFTGSSCGGTASVVSTVTVTNSVVPNSASHTFSSVGPYSWNAVYSGDANNNGATSTCETLTVNRATGVVVATVLSSTSITVGGSVFDSATLTGTTSTASGTIVYNLFQNSGCFGTATLVSNVTVTNHVVPDSASRTFSSAGPYSWNAVYSGDANNAGTTSTCEPLTVNKASPSIATTLSATTITVGQSVTDSATLTGSFQASGSVTYLEFTTGTCSGTSTTVATVTVTNGVVPGSSSTAPTPAGAYFFQASYSGDANNNPVTSPCEPLTVAKAIPTIATALLATSITVGGSTSASATLTGGFNAGGTVTYSFFTGSACAGSATVVGSPVQITNGVVPNSASQTFNSAGSFSWNAVYSGDANNSGGQSSCQPLTVSKATPTITTGLSLSAITVGSSVTDSATLTGGFQAGGTVTYSFYSGGTCSGTSTPVGSPVTVTGGVVPVSASQAFNSAAPFSWNAVYSGDPNNAAATSPCELLTVNKANPTITTTLSSSSIIVGGSVFDSASLASSFQAGGSVTYSLFPGSTCTGTATTVGLPVTVTNGIVPNSASQAFNSAGPYSWNAAYSGDTNNNITTSPCEQLAVTKTNPSVATALSSTSIIVDGSVFDTSALTGSFQAGGTVTYNVFTSGACSGVASVASTVTVANGVPSSRSVTFNNTGTYGWRADYSGDANNNPSTGGCEPLTVNPKGVNISTSLSATTIIVGGSVSDSAALTGATATAGGTVTYNLFTTGSCSGTPGPVSTVTVTNGLVPSSRPVAINSTNPFSWNAIYSGDANNRGVTSPCEPLIVNKTNPTITTSLSATTITVGSAAFDTSTLTGSFQAGGTVTYNLFTGGACNGGATVVSTGTVANGVVTNSASYIFSSAGPYSWNAVYSGDSNNNGATSTCEPLTVNRTTGVVISTALSSTSITVGGSVFDSATLTGTTSTAGGTVTYGFFTGSACTGTRTIVGSPVTVINSVVPNSTSQTFNSAGGFSWNAVYSGDANNVGDTSICEPLTVNKTDPSLTTSLSTTAMTAGQSVTDSATLTGGFHAGGSVAYLEFSTGTCAGTGTTITAVTVTNGVVPGSSAVTPTPAGAYSFEASYSGDANNNPVTSPCEPLAVSKTSPTITTSLSASTITLGGSTTDSATLASFFQAGGTVTYSLFNSGTCSGTGSTLLTVTAVNGIVPNSSPISPLNAGPYGVVASYSGDANNNPTTSNCESLTVNRIGPVLVTTFSASSVTAGTTVHDSATLTGGSSPGGTVTYTLFSNNACSAAGSVIGSPVTVNNGAVPDSASVTPTPAGPYSFQASYSGDANNVGTTSACEPFTVNKASPTVATVLSPTTITVGASVSDSAAITGGYNPGGTVTYSFYAGSACTAPGSIAGSPVTVVGGTVLNSASQIFTSAGPFSWNAVYSGDANNNGATSACEPLTVSKTAPTITTTLSANTITVDGSMLDSSTLTGSFQAGGTVTYSLFTGGTCNGASAVVSTVTVTNGVVPNSASHTFSQAGPYSWNAVYSGDANNNGATSTCEPLTVGKASPTINTLLSATSITVGASVTDSVTLTGGFQAGGTVTYTYYGGSTCSASGAIVGSPVTVTSGVAPGSASQTFNNAGSYSWNAAYSGDANNNPSTSLCEPLTVNKASPTATTTLSFASITVGGSVFDSASLTGGFQAGGSATYFLFTTGNCTGTPTPVSTVAVINGALQNSSPQPFNTVGSFSWNLAYIGDSNNNPANSPCEILTVNKASPAITTTLSATVITVGQSVTDSASLTNGFRTGGTVAYNLFSLSTCSGTPAIVSTETVTNGIVPTSATKIFTLAGAYSWNAVYSGDTNNNPVTSACEPLTVNRTTGVVIATSLSSNTLVVGSSVFDTATLTGVTGTASGSVTYSLFTGGACSGAFSVVSTVTVTNGVAPNSRTVTVNSTNPFSWNAVYSGDANNVGATSTCEPLGVIKASPSISANLSATTIPVGGSVTGSATLTGAYGAASGTVTYTLFNGNDCTVTATVVFTATVSNGIVPSSTAQGFNSAGSFSWNTLYSGDSNNNPATSPCAPLTVNKASPILTIQLSALAITVGGSVRGSGLLSGGFQASGSVTYSSFLGSICGGAPTPIAPSVSVNNGVVPSSASQPFSSAGPVSWDAAYSGDPNNKPATSSCVALTVNKASPTVTSSIPSATIIVGGSTPDTATLTGGFEAGGTVGYNLFSGAACSGNATIVSIHTVSGGVVPSSAPQTFNSAGQYSWNAVYSGDANNNQATSLCAPLTVNKASPVLTTTLSAPTIIVGDFGSSSAILTGAFQAGGTVTYSLFSGGGCSTTAFFVSIVTVTNSIVPGSIPVTFNNTGSYSWSAAYSGDANNNRPASACASLTVNPTGVNVAPIASNTTITVGGSVYFSAAIVGATGTASGTLTYAIFTGSFCTTSPTIISTVAVINRVAPNSAPHTLTTPGSFSWDAIYSGDSNNNPASSACGLVIVNKASPTLTTILSSASIVVGGSASDSATFVGGFKVGGNVTYSIFTGAYCSGTGTPVGSPVAVSNGVAPNSALHAFNSVGSFSWNALYTGDADNSLTTGPCEPLTVQMATPSMTIAVKDSTGLSVSSVVVGASVHDTAVMSNGFNPSGSVVYSLFSGGSCLGAGTLVSTVSISSGLVPNSSSSTPRPPGNYSFKASYDGDSSNGPAASGCVPLTVGLASPSMSAILSSLIITVGGSVRDSVTLTGGYSPGGNVTYSFFTGVSCSGTGTPVGSPVSVTNGIVPISGPVVFNSAGSFGWNVAYSGDINNRAVSGKCQLLQVVPPPTLRVPGLQTVNSGVQVRFAVNATVFPSGNVTLSASGLPAGSSFPAAHSTGAISQIFSWTPPETLTPGNYTVTFTADNGRGGVTSSKVTIHVTAISRTSSLPPELPYLLAVLVGAGLGTIIVVAIFRRKPEKLKRADSPQRRSSKLKKVDRTRPS